MAYSFSAATLNAIYGQFFTIRDPDSGRDAVFRIPSKSDARARGGLEAYGILVSCEHPRHGVLKTFLKIFRHDISARRQRTEFLIHTGLAGRHQWMFHGVPYLWLRQFTINNVAVIGHAALQIGGRFGAPAEDFGRLKSSWATSYSVRQRKNFASQLCVAIAALERMEIVHGDISPGNVMIGPGPTSDPVCTLCDFDGLYHPRLQPLPRDIDGFSCRPLGSHGFQYPELAARIEGDPNGTDTTIVVTTDRFALGAMCCELVVWSQENADRLNRDTLLGTANVRARSLDDIPKQIIAEWPAGFNLLREALKAQRLEQMPSPQDWLSALGTAVRIETPFAQRPIIDISRRSGNRDTFVKTVQLSNDRGSLGPVDPTLSNIRFEFARGVLMLNVGWQPRVFITGKRALDLGAGPISVPLNPGETLVSNGWAIKARTE